ncbi:MAG: prepilin-type N-terminal cleavage/methylation domain-containing protein [Gammaproteobacteria bacterium]|nr:prepilin-type N-terminal cleavage/methylation domain-containing protein [Gammaproteobacteria bacterium]
MRSARQQGFNLIELVVTITVIGIIMAGTLAYVTNSVTAYTATARRDQLTSLGRTAVEKVARELRAALPNSVRVNNNCIEFFPTLGGSIYQTLPVDTAAASFTAVDFSLLGSSGTDYVVVYPYDAAALYAAANPGPLVAYSGKAGSPTATVSLAAAHQFSHQAPQRRFYVVSAPVSYCIVGTDLLRYQNYGIHAVQSAPPGGGSSTLLAQDIQTSDGVVTVTPFTYTPGTLRRSGVIALDFRFLIGGEWIRLTHEVHIQNVL